MNQDGRPNPEELLKRITAEEDEANSLIERTSGRLKIFLGFCAGVGKTYTMLEETRISVKSGTDAVVGIVETHGRKETQALLDGLTIIPRKKTLYNGLELEEMDIDAILERKPSLVIVDELAHTNVIGSRHNKRYQDVEELLKAGIDVYSTLNIQHVESLIDIVQQISFVTIHETVPDSILELADEIELVDLTPEKLLERLNEGKIYIPDKAKVATQKFFRKGNLLALRELALRYTAKRVDEDMISYKNRNAIITPWPVDSKIIVGFSASPTSERLLRITHRMASEMNAKWYAVYVESPQQVEVSAKAAAQLEKNIKLAEELGATVAALSGNGIADTIIHFAKEKNVNFIVAGLSHRSRFEEFFKGSVLNELTRKSGHINVLIVGANPEQLRAPLPKAPTAAKLSPKGYFISLLSVFAIILFAILTRDSMEPLNAGMMLILPVVVCSIFFGTRVGLFTALLSVCALDFFMIPPYYTFRVTDIRYFPSFLVFIIISVIISFLAKGIRWQTEGSRHRERFLASLNSFTREIMLAPDILKTAASHITEAFRCELVILLPNENKHLVIAEKEGEAKFDNKELGVAQWVYKNGSPAGKNTATLASSRWYFLPLKVENNTFGVLGIFMPSEKGLSSEQYRLLESFANIMAIYLKRN